MIFFPSTKNKHWWLDAATLSTIVDDALKSLNASESWTKYLSATLMDFDGVKIWIFDYKCPWDPTKNVSEWKRVENYLDLAQLRAVLEESERKEVFRYVGDRDLLKVGDVVTYYDEEGWGQKAPNGILLRVKEFAPRIGHNAPYYWPIKRKGMDSEELVWSVSRGEVTYVREDTGTEVTDASEYNISLATPVCGGDPVAVLAERKEHAKKNPGEHSRVLGPVVDPKFYPGDQVWWMDPNQGQETLKMIGDAFPLNGAEACYNFDEQGQKGYAKIEEKDLRLDSRGNHYRWATGGVTHFTTIEEEFKFWCAVGVISSVRNPDNGYYSWTLDEVYEQQNTGRWLIAQGAMIQTGEKRANLDVLEIPSNLPHVWEWLKEKQRVAVAEEMSRPVEGKAVVRGTGLFPEGGRILITRPIRDERTGECFRTEVTEEIYICTSVQPEGSRVGPGGRVIRIHCTDKVIEYRSHRASIEVSRIRAHFAALENARVIASMKRFGINNPEKKTD